MRLVPRQLELAKYWLASWSRLWPLWSQWCVVHFHTHTDTQMNSVTSWISLVLSFLPACQTEQSASMAGDWGGVCACELVWVLYQTSHKHTHIQMTPSNRLCYKYHVTVSCSRMMKHPLLSRLCPTSSTLCLPLGLSGKRWSHLTSFHPRDHPPHCRAYGFYIALMRFHVQREYCCLCTAL